MTKGSRSSSESGSRDRAIIGWREWVALPDLGVARIKAKVDTGARTSSLHAFDMERFRRGKREWVRFIVHPVQRSSTPEVLSEARIFEWRSVRPSTGRPELRPVIVTTVEILGAPREVELTLTRRDEMGFRMLLGRQAVRGSFVVDPGRSFLGGRPARGRARRRVADRVSDSRRKK